MARVFEIEWTDLNTTVQVELLDQENPELCDKFWNGLPVKSIFAASMSAGEMFKAPLPFPLTLTGKEKMALFTEEPVGVVVAMGGVGSGLLLKYGEVAEPFRLPPIGRVLECDLDVLRKAAVRLRDAYFFTKEINSAIIKEKRRGISKHGRYMARPEEGARRRDREAV